MWVIWDMYVLSTDHDRELTSSLLMLDDSNDPVPVCRLHLSSPLSMSSAVTWPSIVLTSIRNLAGKRKSVNLHDYNSFRIG